MENKFAMNVTFTAKPGQRDALASILLEGAAALQQMKECELYVILLSDSEPDTVRVNEVWSNAAAHKASLELEETKSAIARAMPIIANVDAAALRAIGGKGV